MIIKYLELTNYRRFKSAKIEMPEGIIGIIGMNGAGKSTIVEAIAWALYGNQVPITRTKKGDVKRYGTAVTEPCSVVLELVLNGDNYRLKREIKGAAQTMHAELTVNGKEEAKGARDVTDLLERRLGMDYKSFFASVFARQKELNALSSEAPNVRKRLVMRMLNIEFLDKVITTVKRDARDTEKTLSGIRETLVDSEGRNKLDLLAERQTVLKAEKKQLGSELKICESVKSTKEKLKTEKEEELKEYTNKYDSYKSHKSELEKLGKQVAARNAELEGLTKELKKLENARKAMEDLQAREDEYHKQLEERERLSSAMVRHDKIVTYEKQLQAGNTKLSELNEQIENFTKQYDFFKSKTEDSEQVKSGLDKALKELEGLNDKLSRTKQAEVQIKKTLSEKETHQAQISELGPNSTCPTCERPLEEHFGFLKNKLDDEHKGLLGELEGLSVELKNLEAARTELTGKKEQHEKDITEIDFNNKKRDGVKKDLDHKSELRESVKTDLKGIEEELGRLGKDTFDRKKYEDVKIKVDKLEDLHEEYIALASSVKNIPEVQKSVDKLTPELADIKNSQEKAEEALIELAFDEQKYQRLQSERNSTNTEYMTAVSDFRTKTLELQRTDEKISDLESQIKGHEQLQSKVKDYDEKVKYLSTLSGLMDGFKINLISRIRPMLSQYASEILGKLTEGKYSELALDEDYEISIFDSGEKFQLKRFSGGEEDIANLSLRLAISRVIAESAGTAGANMIILDEIFGSQDPHRKRNIISVLGELSNQYQQIFLITHIEEMKENMGFVLDVHDDIDGECSVIDVIN
jgi:exonuclease SbcC